MCKTVDEKLEDSIKSSNECLIEFYHASEFILTKEQQKAKERAINKLIEIASLPKETQLSLFDFEHINQMMENLKIPHRV